MYLTVKQMGNTKNPMSSNDDDEVEASDRTTDWEFVVEDVEIGRRSIFQNGAIQAKRSRNRIVELLGDDRIHYVRAFFLSFLILPMSLYYLALQLKMFVVVGIFNYFGINVRPYLVYDIETERETMMIREKYSRGPYSFGKIKYIAHRYMTYWVVVIVLIVALRFINRVDQDELSKLFNDTAVFKGSKALSYLVQIIISFIIGFANLIPAKSIRPDISSFLSSFTEQDIVIRDSAHTRMKDLTEVLDDLKTYRFTLFTTDIGSPIIVSTVIPEELNSLPGFLTLLSTQSFDNNQILRFIQIEEDVDSFFVMRNDIGMCHFIDHYPFRWDDIRHDLHSFKLRVEISDLELNFYGGATIVLLVGLFAAERNLHVSAILAVWVIWPVIFALIYRRKRSKLASINFFTLSGRDREYQPYHNISISSDNVIQKRITEFLFFVTLFKVTTQGRFLLHVVLKCTESVKYDWLITGLQVRDFKRLVAMACTVHLVDIAVVTPSSRMLYTAPKRRKIKEKEHLCVVFTISTKDRTHRAASIISAEMTLAQFNRAFNDLPFGHEDNDFETLFLSERVEPLSEVSAEKMREE